MAISKKLKRTVGIEVEPDTKESFIKRFWKNLLHRNPEDRGKHGDKLN